MAPLVCPKSATAAALALALSTALLLVGASSWAGPGPDAPIPIGRSLPLTGPFATYGMAKLHGQDAYIAAVNRAGGVHGRTIKLITLDDRYEPESTVANLRELEAHDHVLAYLGLFGVPTVAAAIPVLTSLGVPGIGLTSGMPAVREPFNRYLFPVRASYREEAKRIVRHIRTLGLERLVIIRQDIPFGQATSGIFAAEARAAGMAPPNQLTVSGAGGGAEAASRWVHDHDCQVVFLAALSNAAVPVLDALKKNAPGVAVYAFSPVDATVISSRLGPEAAGLGITQIVPIPRSSIGGRVVREYIADLKVVAPNEEPSFYGLEAFIEAKVLVEGLERAGEAPTRQRLISALEGLGQWDAGDFPLVYTRTLHAGSDYVELTVVTAAGRVIR